MIFPKKVLIISFVVIAAAVLVFFVFIQKKPERTAEESRDDDSASSRKVEEASLLVKVTEARRGDLVMKLRSPGEAVASLNVTMRAEVPGAIKNLLVEESQHVQKGGLLVELDDAQYRLSLQNAEAERLRVLSEYLVEKRFAGQEKTQESADAEKVEKAKSRYEETRLLYRQGKISKEAFERASMEYEIAMIEAGEKKEEILAATKRLTQNEIAVKEAQLNLEKTNIRAPFSGIVFDIQVSPGEHVAAGRELFKLVNISQVQVLAKVLESEISKMKVGREVDLRFSAYPEKVFRGKVRAISPVINPEDRTCRVTIEVANPEEELKPGMHAEVEIAAEVHRDRLLIPQEAVLVRGGRKLAFVVEGDLAKWRYIDCGLENEEFVEVLDGIQERDLVIIDGHFTMAHDARVAVEK